MSPSPRVMTPSSSGYSLTSSNTSSDVWSRPPTLLLPRFDTIETMLQDLNGPNFYGLNRAYARSDSCLPRSRSDSSFERGDLTRDDGTLGLQRQSTLPTDPTCATDCKWQDLVDRYSDSLEKDALLEYNHPRFGSFMAKRSSSKSAIETTTVVETTKVKPPEPAKWAFWKKWSPKPLTGGIKISGPVPGTFRRIG
ncbi:hypothetical protein RUND412_005102 [Rhizina undulata]